MAQRHVCPSMGALRRSILRDIPAASVRSSQAFHSSVWRLEEPSSSATPSASAPTTRKERSVNALKQITNLGQSRPPVRRTSLRASGTGASDQSASTPAGERRTNPTTAKLAAGPRTNRGAAPPGQMARAPSQLRVKRTDLNNATVGTTRGPNLRGRDRDGRKPSEASKNSSERTPKKRSRPTGDEGGGGAEKRKGFDDIEASETLNDGMVRQLLRLQRKEWDRTPYEPKYAKGSFAANELIHAGRELFKGESAPVKIWGPLERTIGVVGMYGAEAHLKVRRVGDGDAEPFGQEVLELEGAEEARDIANKADAIAQPPQV